MKVIISQTIEEFEILQNKINNSLITNAENYNAEKWAEPSLLNELTGQYACPIEIEGFRGQIILNNCLSEDEINSIINLDQNDEIWFPKNNLFNY